ncbi:hypothetical protein F4677DRAFT_462258 [Hypoxylon crocopeplum]|nr:hypothetical protein F4677DRAFT_462258 [Hypoxylon crocopeplum]
MAKKVPQDELGTFSSAVANCLASSSPSRLDFDLENDSFLEWYYQTIVLPLNEDYEVFLAESPAIPPPRMAKPTVTRQPAQPGPSTPDPLNGRDTQQPRVSQSAPLAQNTSSTPGFKSVKMESRQSLQRIKTVLDPDELGQSKTWKGMKIRSYFCQIT